MNDLLKSIKETQSLYPALFAETQKTDFGVLFYNANNTLSVEANHGVLYEPCNYTAAMEQTAAFYTRKQIPPRLYCYLPPDHLPALQRAATETGGQVIPSDLLLMVCQSPGKEIPSSPLTFEVLKEWDPGIAEHIIGENLHLEGLLRGSMQHDTYRLVVGRLFGTPVTMAGLWDNGKVMRISNVMTGEAFRGCGFAFALIKNLLATASKPVYLFANNPVAIRVYERAGLTIVKPDFQLFTVQLF